MKSGFTLIEILVASVILTMGLMTCLLLFTQSQRMMLASSRFETAQRVLAYFEMVHPMPDPDQVSSDPEDDDLLNISSEDAVKLAEELDIDLSPRDRDDLAGYSVRREVDEVEDDEELERNGGIYTVRTTVTWGGYLTGKPEEETVVSLWWKEAQSKK